MLFVFPLHHVLMKNNFCFNMHSGYLAPEYAMGGQLTLKADVYSFGVLILEIISGQSSAKTNWGGSNKFLLEWVRFQLLIFKYFHKYLLGEIRV